MYGSKPLTPSQEDALKSCVVPVHCDLHNGYRFTMHFVVSYLPGDDLEIIQVDLYRDQATATRRAVDGLLGEDFQEELSREQLLCLEATVVEIERTKQARPRAAAPAFDAGQFIFETARAMNEVAIASYRAGLKAGER